MTTKETRIVMGGVLAFIYPRLTLDRFKEKVIGLGAFLLSVAMLTFIIFYLDVIFMNNSSMVWCMALIAMAWTLFLYAILVWKPLQDFFGSQILAGFGRLTYGMYIFHNFSIFVVDKILNLFLPGQEAMFFWLTRTLSILIFTWVLAKMSWKLIEQPFYKMKEKYSRVISGYKSNDEVQPVLMNN